ncbi:MAG: dihydroorotase [Gammaproteobacteria bacterium]|nr:dihydroorotase [Gammaproteobacteria bacterium]
MRSFCITRPDDWHVHFRDGEMLKHTVLATARYFGRALAMPNLVPPLTSVDALLAYQARIMDVADIYPHFKLYSTFYLNESVLPEALIAAKAHAFILGGKFYPAGVTTNSEQGARSMRALYPVFEAMQASNLVLQIHGEVLKGDIFDREALFIEEYLKDLIRDFPKLRIVLEHISTKAAVDFVTEAPPTLVATITPHHLLYNRNQLLAGGIRPHYYCLPILKHERDQRALQVAASSGNPKFFAGTDSAPHGKNQKECASGCAGIYSAPFALSMYAEVFEAMDAQTKLNAFLGRFGAEFYQLSVSDEQIELVREAVQVPEKMALGKTTVLPVHAGGQFAWSVR